MRAATCPGAVARPVAVQPALRCQRVVVVQSCASFTVSPSTYSSNYGMELVRGPICPWPRTATFAQEPQPKASAAAAQGRSLWEGAAAFFGFQEAQGLPEEVERLALFCDAPEALPAAPEGWAALWRYQGFK